VRITRIELRDFRNYTSWRLETQHPLTILIGPNAAGKTNVLEAIESVSTGRSFRNPSWGDVVRWGADEAVVSTTAEGDRSPVHSELTVSADGQRSWRVDGQVRRRVHDATRFVPVVVFTPEDLMLVRGPAERRRSGVDGLGDQLSATYATLRREYARVLRQKNALLKSESPDATLGPWNEQIIRLGARLHVHRRRLVRRLTAAAVPVYEGLACGETLKVEMRATAQPHEGHQGGDEEITVVECGLREEIGRRAGDERARGVSLVGPHRDDVIFTIGEHDARSFASQGQQRTLALAWKWAEVTVVREVLGTEPVLLLDDVMSELDASRREALADLVSKDIQTFITTTTTSYFDDSLLDRAKIVPVGGGCS
jgi:DNA replication and repair protein RecF